MRDLKSAVDRKIPIYVVSDDLAERGIAASQLIAGVEPIARGAVARLIVDHDRILTW